ncbi:hypothetical protein PPACK8108_LOCUS7142 [Phakopsora pachyrhizi]|uniref:Uncharacterized protein n=1 Tax=Phakopsora pachyrhizi TaxID=170000 RepID=A0AAV0ASE0_PHAPC|nr:hypothetical protein PPACK8108_LOCUS7142 [Phakopsora pachyrhizi]
MGAAINSPGTLHNSHGPGSYFGSLRNFVGFTGINEEESNSSELRLRKNEKASKLISGESSSSTQLNRGTLAFGLCHGASLKGRLSRLQESEKGPATP